MTDSNYAGSFLRLIWPQWQGATPANVSALTQPLPDTSARLGYHIGSHLLRHLAPQHDGPERIVPVSITSSGLKTESGVFARDVLLEQLRTALMILTEEDAGRVLTLGGECSVSVAPFSHLAARYSDDVAVVWIDAHPDTGVPGGSYEGYHAMAVSHLLGHGDPDVVAALPAVFPAARVALAGLHVWEDDQEPLIREWGLTSFSPTDLRRSSTPIVEWLRSTGCSKVAIHLDVDAIDSDEVVLGLGAEPGGLSIEQVVRLVGDVSQAAEVVGLTVAEYIPRQAIIMRDLLARLPLLSHG
ncbi:arginase family protein [Aeromicrobium sp. CFBP 8757]|uniref:arginase family protein n=1 Tax=Aeromicrobium sp. CFBP 8757 TaxID=2775288 RepID=UPI00177C7E40|nr:arginase family protein [Aeromicrobium sp. CFBP 8757]MBD8605421.1 arginase family protein [Aeromicrobium sp. CFBP 8757]